MRLLFTQKPEAAAVQERSRQVANHSLNHRPQPTDSMKQIHIWNIYEYLKLRGEGRHLWSLQGVWRHSCHHHVTAWGPRVFRVPGSHTLSVANSGCGDSYRHQFAMCTSVPYWTGAKQWSSTELPEKHIIWREAALNSTHHHFPATSCQVIPF